MLTLVEFLKVPEFVKKIRGALVKNKIEIRTEHFPRFQLSTKENDENLYDEVVS